MCTINLIHTLRITCTTNAVNEAKTLDSQLKQFWELHNIGIKENEKSVAEEFIETVK